MERRVEMQKLENQIEFSKNIKPIPLYRESRWLIRSGQVNQLQSRGDDAKLTFGKRFTKIPLVLFLFNDVLLVCRSKGEDQFLVIHHCPRSMVELSSDSSISLSTKEVQNRNMIFLTILENQEQKTIEMVCTFFLLKQCCL